MKSIVALVSVLCCCALSVAAFRHHDHVEAGAPPKVKVDLYFESMCPDCKIMLTQNLYPAYTNGLDKIMDLTLVPYGNAHEKEDKSGHWTFECQHGDDECAGNIIETCAIKLYPAVSQHLPFLKCVDSSDDGVLAAAPDCAKQNGMDWTHINTCAQGADGNKYEHEMAVLTEKLTPAHTWVPWIIIDGKHSEDADADPVSAICQAYTGNRTVINACTKISVALYYESYCPGCRELITTNLFPAMLTGGLTQIVDLTLVPYGNTQQVDTNGTTPETRYNYTCQHGEQECTVDVYEQCALNDNYLKSFNFIHCVENSTDPLSSSQLCSASTGLDWNDLQSCAQQYAWQMQEMFANMTNALVPPHQWVPWVIINGTHPGETPTVDCDSDAVTCICQAYKGVAKVAACEQALANLHSGHASAHVKKTYLKTEARASSSAVRVTKKFARGVAAAAGHTKKNAKDKHRQQQKRRRV